MKKSKLPSLITLLVLTLITVLMWIGFMIYWAVVTGPEPSVPGSVSAKLTPSLDSDTIDKIDSALFFNKSEIPQTSFPVSPGPLESSLPTPAPPSTPAASPSATISETATPAATLTPSI